MKKPFTRHDYAVMRHGRDDGKVIVLESREICARIASELATYISHKGEGRFSHGVSIFHSPQARAKLTAEIVRNELTNCGIEIPRFELTGWLDCDEYLISEARVATVMASCGGSLGLFISHRPDIEEFLGDEYGDVSNCSLFSAELTIKGH